MNKVILMGRLTREPEVRYSNGAEPLAVARYTLAINRRMKKNGEQEADFIPCVAFGKSGATQRGLSLRSSTLRKAKTVSLRRRNRTSLRRMGSIPLTKALRMTICHSDGSQ